MDRKRASASASYVCAGLPCILCHTILLSSSLLHMLSRMPRTSYLKRSCQNVDLIYPIVIVHVKCCFDIWMIRQGLECDFTLIFRHELTVCNGACMYNINVCPCMLLVSEFDGLG